MNGMNEQQRKINKRLAKPTPLVSDAEVEAAMGFLSRASDLAGRSQPIPWTIMRCILEEAAMVRVGMIKLSALSNGQ